MLVTSKFFVNLRGWQLKSANYLEVLKRLEEGATLADTIDS